MKIYLLLAEDPFYTKPLVEKIVNALPGQIVGAGFPAGFIKLKRIIKTFFIYGPLKFIKVALIVMLNDVKGGKVKNYLKSNDIPVNIIIDINEDSFLDYLRTLKVDLIVSNNCPQRLKRNILGIPIKGSINLHLGKLPAYRGVFPVLHAIVNGEKEFGVTVHYMNVKFDDGPILNQEIIPIDEGENLFALYPKAFEVGANLLVKAIRDIQNGSANTIPNGPEGKSYYSYPNFRQIFKYHERIMQAENKKD